MLQINRSYLIVENNLIPIPLIILSVSITVFLVNYLFIYWYCRYSNKLFDCGLRRKIPDWVDNSFTTYNSK